MLEGTVSFLCLFFLFLFLFSPSHTFFSRVRTKGLSAHLDQPSLLFQRFAYFLWLKFTHSLALLEGNRLERSGYPSILFTTTKKRQLQPVSRLLLVFTFESLLQLAQSGKGFFCTKLTISPTTPPPAIVPFYSKHFPLCTAKCSSRPRLSLDIPTGVTAKMPAPPALGALGMTFTAMRALQAISLITIIGLASNFISEMVTASYVPPPALVGTLVVVRFSVASVKGVWLTD